MADSKKNILPTTLNRTRTEIGPDFLVHSVIEDKALTHPYKLAMEDATRKLSYSELNRKANQIAHHLLRYNPKKEALICVVMERSIDAVITYLGVLKAGCAYSPIDPEQPDSRLNRLLQESQAPIVVTHRAVKERLAISTLMVCLDDDAGSIAGESIENPRQSITLEHLAYVIYTSGSTGFPKGVEIEHGSLTNLCRWYLHFFNYSTDDRATQIAGAGFDATIGEIWPTLAAGASLHFPDGETRMAMDKLARWFIDNDISITFLPTALAELFISMPLPKELKLRCLTAGGERLKRGPSQPLNFAFYNIYGPTENTDVSTCALIPNVPDPSPPPIGRPIDNVEAYLFDDASRPTPFGEVGELYLGGKDLARGYRNNPELTAKYFITHPYKPGERLYKTGDLCRLRSNGDLEFVGRNDDQVKIRGFRIELGEIEYALSHFSGVKRTVVMVRRDNRDEPQLVGYIMPLENVRLDTREIMAYLKSRLPAYMVPAAFVILDEFPLTTNQKTDKTALPAPDIVRPDIPAVQDLPQTIVEQMVYEVWQEVLPVKAMSIDDNFFELGGHSLMATLIVNRFNKILPVSVPISALFRHTTIRRLALFIEELIDTDGLQA